MNRSYETYWGIIWDYNDCFDTIDDNRRRSPLESWLIGQSEDDWLKIKKQIDEQKAFKENIFQKLADIETLLKQQCCDVPFDAIDNMVVALWESFDLRDKIKDILSKNGFDKWNEMYDWECC